MTNYLFAEPSIIAGIASCIDLFAVYNMYNESKDEASADKRAMLADILTLKSDFSNACKEVINVA
ncbi:MAG: hypothetical protein IJP71_02950 [Lachnospiraceae bacterium]|nr:hypothetical protein [Lachnospiraceae bacterium]